MHFQSCKLQVKYNSFEALKDSLSVKLHCACDTWNHSKLRVETLRFWTKKCALKKWIQKLKRMAWADKNIFQLSMISKIKAFNMQTLQWLHQLMLFSVCMLNALNFDIILNWKMFLSGAAYSLKFLGGDQLPISYSWHFPLVANSPQVKNHWLKQRYLYTTVARQHLQRNVALALQSSGDSNFLFKNLTPSGFIRLGCQHLLVFTSRSDSRSIAQLELMITQLSLLIECKQPVTVTVRRLLHWNFHHSGWHYFCST